MWELRWPILALTKDHSMALLELLKRPVHIDGVGVVSAWLSGGGRFALVVYAPRQETLEFRDLVLGDTDGVLHHAPVVDGVAGWDRHRPLVSVIVFCANLQKPLVGPPMDVFVVFHDRSLELSSLELTVDFFEVGIFVVLSLSSKVFFADDEFTFKGSVVESNILWRKFSWILSMPKSQFFFGLGRRC